MIAYSPFSNKTVFLILISIYLCILCNKHYQFINVFHNVNINGNQNLQHQSLGKMEVVRRFKGQKRGKSSMLGYDKVH